MRISLCSRIPKVVWFIRLSIVVCLSYSQLAILRRRHFIHAIFFATDQKRLVCSCSPLVAAKIHAVNKQTKQRISVRVTINRTKNLTRPLVIFVWNLECFYQCRKSQRSWIEWLHAKLIREQYPWLLHKILEPFREQIQKHRVVFVQQKKKKNKIDANNTKEYLKKNKQFLHNSDLNASAHFHYRISTNAINCRVNHWRWLYYTHHRNYLSFFTCYQCQIQWISNSTITHCICVCVSDSLVMAVMPNFNNIQITEWQTI